MPPTVVLIHGLWMTSRSWEHWKERYERRGYDVLTPAYPGLQVEVEALREDPSPIADLSVPDTLAHLESVIRELDRPPLLMGHSFGGLLMQLLLDRGLGAAGVAIDSAPPEGIRKVPLAQIKATFAVLENPANRHRAVPFTLKQFHYAFTNTLSEEESAEVYERYHVAGQPLELRALQVGGAHEIQGVRGPQPLHARPAGLGERRRLRAQLV
jgi:pimeloyl-ACP methyl ester carboxylesterase